MTYQTSFVSSEREELKRRALLSGARRFSFLGREFYYSYSPKLLTLKERINMDLFKMEKTLNHLGEDIKNEYRRSCLLNEIFSSCELDGYPHPKRLEWLYFKNKPIEIKNRAFPIKNLSLIVGFAPSSPCKNLSDIARGFAILKELEERLMKEDFLIWALIEHFLFEYIHPYQCHNGIVGRWRIYKSLIGTPYEFLGMRFAASFLNHEKDYFLSFKRAETSSDLNDYLEMALSSLSNEISKCLQDLKEKEKRWDDAIKRLEPYSFKPNESKTAKGILMMKIFGRQKLNITRLAKILRKSERSVFRNVSSLKRLGFKGFDTPN